MRRHKVLTGVGALMAVGAAGNLGGSDSDPSTQASAERRGVVSVPSESSSPEPVELTATDDRVASPSPTAARATATAVPAPSRAAVRLTPTPKPVVTTAPKPAVTKAPAPAAKEYDNCAALNADYPHGVGRPGARDQTKTGNPVTDYKVSQELYDANTKSDRDGDGIACEKH